MENCIKKECINYVLGFAISLKENKIVLVKKNSPEWQKGLLNGIGGKVLDDQENFRQAMVREFFEATDIKTNVDDWNYFDCLDSESEEYYVKCYYIILNSFNDVKQKSEDKIIFINLDKMLYMYSDEFVESTQKLLFNVVQKI